MRRDHVDRWEQGNTVPDVEVECKGRVNTIRELRELEFKHMLDFYDEPKNTETEDGTEIDTD